MYEFIIFRSHCIIGIQKQMMSKYMFVKQLSNNVCLCQNSHKELFIMKYGSNNSFNLLKEILITKLLSTGSCLLSKSKLINIMNYKNVHIDENVNANKEHESDSLFCNIFKCMNRCLCCEYKSYMNDDITSSNDEMMIVYANDDVVYKIINKKHDISLYSTIVSIEQSMSRYYMILNHAGLDLYEYVTKRKCLSEDMCKTIFRQLVQAIKSMHVLGIAHGDISLENICVSILLSKNLKDNSKEMSNNKTTSAIKIKLIDFGLSLIHPMSPYYGIISRIKNITKQQTSQFTYDRAYIVNGLDDINIMHTKLKPDLLIYGKTQYISPERYDAHLNEHNSYCSYADDVYSLGIVLFCMLLGRIPYETPNESNRMFKEIMTGSWRSKVKKYSDHVIELIDMILKREDKRISLDQIMKHQWLK